jgi:hypothetical protein
MHSDYGTSGFDGWAKLILAVGALKVCTAPALRGQLEYHSSDRWREDLQLSFEKLCVALRSGIACLTFPEQPGSGCSGSGGSISAEGLIKG